MKIGLIWDSASIYTEVEPEADLPGGAADTVQQQFRFQLLPSLGLKQKLKSKLIL